jgi:hypothetical protein
MQCATSPKPVSVQYREDEPLQGHDSSQDEHTNCGENTQSFLPVQGILQVTDSPSALELSDEADEVPQSWGTTRSDSASTFAWDPLWISDELAPSSPSPLRSPTTSFDFLPFSDEADGVPQSWDLIQSDSTSTFAWGPLWIGEQLALSSTSPLRSPTFDFCVPSFSEFSELPNHRALVDHFCNVLSHLIVFREETGNPFQQLVLPLCHNSSPVMNAIYALASAHLECRGVATADKSAYFHDKAIQGLTQLIQENTAKNRNELLAAIMLLVYCEVVSTFLSHPPQENHPSMN